MLQQKYSYCTGVFTVFLEIEQIEIKIVKNKKEKGNKIIS
jgi:hypothetical protein